MLKRHDDLLLQKRTGQKLYFKFRFPGNNKWACDRCAKLQAERETASSSDANVNEDEEEAATKKKPATVYSNASKQLLIFTPPAVLTVHLKRFQQTMTGLRKVSRHVEFPMVLDLAPFCSATSAANANVPAGLKAIKYYLFGVVEHVGRLHGGHYTAFVKARPGSKVDFSDMHSSPEVRTDDIASMLKVIEDKLAAANKAAPPPKTDCEGDEEEGGEGQQQEPPSTTPEEDNNNNNVTEIPAGKWSHISDASVSEVQEQRVKSCQAYLLFYERVN